MKLGGPGWTPTNQFTIATDGTPGYEQIKVMLEVQKEALMVPIEVSKARKLAPIEGKPHTTKD